MAQGIDKFNELLNFVSSMSDDMEKFYDKKNKAAGTRARKSLQKLKVMAQDLRVGIQEVKNK
ncbi:MAG: histone H1 [Bacteroidetes bacterium]|nr:histone H1 [Bacteroidota bacterium]